MIQTLLPYLHFAAGCRSGFFGLPTWYKYLQVGDVTDKSGNVIATCQVINFNLPGDLILVVLALVDMLLRIAGIAAIFFIVYAGIQYATSQGNPDATAKAQNTIINALIGLALSVVAIAGVSFLGNKLG